MDAYLAPVSRRERVELLDDTLTTSPDGEELDALLVELPEVLVSRKLTIKDEVA